jgi:glycosyltransferase involved in cell wall biosynthesis
MTADPTVTLVMPSHNRGPKIAAALDSVLAQTRVPDEVIVVNDGGYAPTAEFVAARYPTVRVLNVPHGGAALARNRGAEAAAGRVLVFFDDDDVMLPHAVATLLGLLATFPEARAAHTDHTFTNTVTGEHHPNHHFFLPQYVRLRTARPLRAAGPDRVYAPGGGLYRALLWGNLLQQPWAMYRDAFLAVGGFSPDLTASDDWDMFLRTARAIPIAVSDAICSHHYLEKDRPHLTLMAGQIEAQVRILRRVRAATPWHDWRTRLVVRRRLGILHKTLGDRFLPADVRSAWREYRRAFRAWPFDRVVAARALVLWPLKLLAGRGRPAPAEGRA